MNRWDILNAFIEKHNYKSYLEIGYYKGWSFDQVKCDIKEAVDPNPCKDEVQQVISKGKYIGEPFGYSDGRANTLYKMTSDKYFADFAPGFIYDIIFIDGLHEANQVEKDIENALKHLSPGGTIVLHDCNPPKYEHTTTGIDGCWTGDTYKAFAQFRFQNPDYTTYVIDTDWGCGVIQEHHSKVDWREKAYNFSEAIADWKIFDENRKDILNLISVEEFKTKLNNE